jgi:hypothetical protein
MLEMRREWAQSEGLNPDVIAKMYSDLVNHFIEEEMKLFLFQKAVFCCPLVRNCGTPGNVSRYSLWTWVSACCHPRKISFSSRISNFLRISVGTAEQCEMLVHVLREIIVSATSDVTC